MADHMKRARVRAMQPVARDDLLATIMNTYDDSRFLVGINVSDGESYLNGLTETKYERRTKNELLALVKESPFEVFPHLKGHEREDLVINPGLFVYKASINQSQVFESTPGAEEYEHCCYKVNVHYDVYFRFNHERKTVTFALGRRKKEVPLEEHSGWAWKYRRNILLCMSSEDLERTFRDPFWSGYMVTLGRRYLGIKPVIV